MHSTYVHIHMKRLNVESWIKPKQTQCWNESKICNANEQKDDLKINHSLVPLFEQNWMRTPNAKEMESFFKIDLRDVLWWMSIKNTCKPKMLITIKLSKEMCISLTQNQQRQWRLLQLHCEIPLYFLLLEESNKLQSGHKNISHKVPLLPSTFMRLLRLSN